MQYKEHWNLLHVSRDLLSWGEFNAQYICAKCPFTRVNENRTHRTVAVLKLSSLNWRHFFFRQAYDI